MIQTRGDKISLEILVGSKAFHAKLSQDASRILKTSVRNMHLHRGQRQMQLSLPARYHVQFHTSQTQTQIQIQFSCCSLTSQVLSPASCYNKVQCLGRNTETGINLPTCLTVSCYRRS